MLIKKGTKLKIHDCRKGTYIGIAGKDFDTEDEWYDIIVADEQEVVVGRSTEWGAGDRIPCRKGHVRIEVIK